MAGGIKLAPLMTEIKVDIDNFKSDMHKASSLGISEAEKISKEMSKTAKVGETLSKTGDALIKGLTIPIVGVGAAATKMAVDYESSFAKVSTLLDSNIVDFGTYKEDIIKASNETKVAVDEFSEAVYSSISAGVEQTKAVGFTTDAMKLAKGGFTDGAKAVDILTTAINGYNLKTEDATKISDLLITTQNLGKTTVDELASSMGTVIPVAKSVNFGLEELSASYAQLTKNGIATAESGTYLKAMLSELGKSGSITDNTLRELTGKGFAQLKEEGVSTSDILKMLSEEAEKNGKTLKDMFGSVEAGSAALVLAKGNGEEYNEMLNGMANSAGATQEAFEKMDATPAEQLKGSLNELKNAGIEFGAAFVPVIEKASDVLGNAAKAFSNLSDEQQQNVIKWGLVLAAAGPVIKTVGGGIQTYTKLSSVIGGASKALGAFGTTQATAAAAAEGTATAVGTSGLTGSLTGLLGICLPVAAGVAAVGTGIYAAHEYGELMDSTVLKSTEDMSIMERIVAKLTGTETYSREELEKMGFVQKEFSEDISPEFQKAVENSTEKLNELSVFLREIGFDDVITEEESDEFNQRISDMCDEAINTIQSKKDESQKGLKELFIADDEIIDESEQKVLDIISESSDKQITEVQNLKDEIVAIKQKAVDEGRALNEQEIADVESKTERIRQIELEAIGGTQEEILYAKNEFAARVKTMDAESASELLQEKAKARDEEIVQIQASYDTEIEMLKSKAAQCTDEEKKALEEQIANLESDKQKKIDMQNQLYDEYMNIIREKNPELLDIINQYNGEILTNEDLAYQERLYNLMNNYDGLAQITESGCYQIYNIDKGHWENMCVSVDENTGAIVGMYNETTHECGGYTEKMAQDAENMASRQSGAYEMIGASLGLYVGRAGQIMDANGNVVASMDELKAHTDGTRTGIVEINGTPYNITVNKDGTISALQEISDAADEVVAKPRTIKISAEFMNNPSIAAYNGVKADQYGWHFNGLDNVPYDGYRAVLHKGERVLTAEENKNYSAGSDVNYGTIKKIIRNELSAITIKLNGRDVGRAMRDLQ